MREQLVDNLTQTYGGISQCTSITVHETANTGVGANAQAHANLQSNGNVRQASWHITVDDTEAIRSYLDTAQCWHAGPAGADSIAVEICVNSDGDYDKAFARAGAVVSGLREARGLTRADVHQHNHWTGKNCPAQMRLSDRWQEFLNLTDPKENTMGSMVSPFEGRLTANHHTGGGYRGHRGMDIAPPKPGQTGKPVYAAFAGTVKEIHRGARHGNRNSTWAPQRTGNGGLIANPDGEGNGYNHVTMLASLKVGDWVNAGELIGHNDTSGTQSGPHLHFEMWGSWKDPYSDYNPRLAFDAHGVRPGSAPKAIIAPVAVKPKPKPASKPAAKPEPAGTVKQNSGNSKQSNKAIAELLNKLGYKAGIPDGVPGTYLRDGVKAYQDAQTYFPGMNRDGDWGRMTQAHYEWVQVLQRNLNLWAGSDIRVDGDHGTGTRKRVREVMDRNKGRAYKGIPDGVPGPVFCKMLGIPKHPSA